MFNVEIHELASEDNILWGKCQSPIKAVKFFDGSVRVLMKGRDRLESPFNISTLPAPGYQFRVPFRACRNLEALKEVSSSNREVGDWDFASL